LADLFPIRCFFPAPAAHSLTKKVDSPGSRQSRQQCPPVPDRLFLGQLQRIAENFLKAFIRIRIVSHEPARGPPNGGAVCAENRFPINSH
jgi:hypothetical protein